MDWVLDSSIPAVGERVRWDFVSDARDWDRAYSRAQTLVEASVRLGKDSSEKFWQATATGLLASLLCYSAHTKPDEYASPRGLHELLGMIQPHDATSEDASVLSGIVDGLAYYMSSQSHPAVVKAHEFMTSPVDTQKDALQILRTQVFASFNRAEPDGCGSFTIDDLLAGRSTLYLVARLSQATDAGPLVATFLTELGEEWATRSQDVTLLMALDEVSNIAPIPKLPTMVNTLGGSGVQFLLGFQDTSRARVVWGEEAVTLTRNLNHRIVLRGTTDTDFLADLERLLPRVPRAQTMFRVTSSGHAPGPSPERLVEDRKRYHEVEQMRPVGRRIAGRLLDQELRMAQRLDGFSDPGRGSERRVRESVFSRTALTHEESLRPQLTVAELTAGPDWGNGWLLTSGQPARAIQARGHFEEPLWQRLLAPNG